MINQPRLKSNFLTSSISVPSIINLENTRPNNGSTPPEALAIIEIVPVGAIHVVVALRIPYCSI